MSDSSNKTRPRLLLLLGLAVGFCFLVLLARGTTGTLFAQSSMDKLASLVGLDLSGKTSTAVEVSDESIRREPTSIDGTVANCRYGLAVVGNGQRELLDDFGAGVYVDFGFSTNPLLFDAQYLPKISTQENKNGCDYLGTYYTRPDITITDPNDTSGLRYWLQRYPGMTWLIGNEVDRGPNESAGECQSNQGDMQPETYARALHDTIEYIRTYDPTAQTSVSGLVEVTPGRLQYLDIVWETHKDLYGNPPDIDFAAMHLYILPEATPAGVENNIAAMANGTDPALAIRESGGNPNVCDDPQVYCFAEHDDISEIAAQVVAMRQWMKDNGLQQKPLLLTEFSLLYPYVDDGGTCFIQDEFGNCFTPERVQTFMDNIFNYLETAADPNLGYALDNNRLVQQWIWFSINNQDDVGSVSNLYNDDGNGNLTTLRPLGQQFIDHVYDITPAVNLLPDGAAFPSAATDGTGTADVPIWINFRNNGNAHVPQTFNVSFYSNSGLTNLIGTAEIDLIFPVAGCAQRAYKATVTWNDVTPGLHRYWAKVDAQNVVVESKENDNVIQGAVYVDLPVQYLPVNHR